VSRLAVALVAAALSGCGAPAPAPPSTRLVERDVFLMGTRARIAVYDSSREQALATAEQALAILEHTEAELSTWRADSLISRLNRQPVGAPFTLPDAACRLFGRLEEAVAMSASAFDPAIGRLIDAWDIHGAGRVPDEHSLTAARRTSGWPLLDVDRTACRVTRLGDVTIDVGAFGKGEALDRVRAAIGGTWLIDLGGQVAVSGVPPDEDGWRVSIAHARHRAQRALDVVLRGGSLSTSGGSERDLDVDGRRVSHLLDPRTGAPASFDGSVSVWHAGGLQADILSTVLYVMGPDAGIAWASARDLAAAYVLPQHGDRVRIVETPGFARLRAAAPTPR
jgi:thiamine biosynthesis lipoprotein